MGKKQIIKNDKLTGFLVAFSASIILLIIEVVMTNKMFVMLIREGLSNHSIMFAMLSLSMVILEAPILVHIVNRLNRKLPTWVTLGYGLLLLYNAIFGLNQIVYNTSLSAYYGTVITLYILPLMLIGLVWSMICAKTVKKHTVKKMWISTARVLVTWDLAFYVLILLINGWR